jgi:hypothetical protein
MSSINDDISITPMRALQLLLALLLADYALDSIHEAGK